MDSLQLLHTFREVAARGSFSRAAVRLRMARPTVSKHVAELERRFDVRLLNRSTRAVSLTDAGQVLLDRSGPLIEMAAMTRAELRGRASHPRGRLRLTVAPGLEHSGFPDILGAFVAAHPDVHISLHVTNRAVDLVRDGWDLALRVGRLRDENMIVRRLARVDWAMCASPAYWARAGVPRHPDELHGHGILRLTSLHGVADVPVRVDGQERDIAAQTRVEADDPSALLRMAVDGLGIVSGPADLARPHVERGALVPVLAEFMPRDIWFHAAYVQRRHQSAAMRTLLGFLESRIALQAIAQEPKQSADREPAGCL
jgi:DNA-binding transcriptional LysR family regulator